MKKIALSFLAIGLAFAGCKKEMIENTVDDLNDMDYKKSDKVMLCHLDDYGNYITISVAPAAVPAHMAHGDMEANPDGTCGCNADNPDFIQDYSVNADGWYASNYAVGTWNYGLISVINGVGIFDDANDSGPFSRFDGYTSTWPVDGWVAETDIYLDPSWATSSGFDYSVAANGSDNLHQRDFIFHVTKDASTGKLLVAGSNNTNFAVREDLENINHYEVTTAGWYTFRHTFRDAGGYLAVDLQLVDINGTVLFTETRSNAADLIPTEVGGNRYGWFTFIAVDGGIQVDNTKLFRCAPY